jgi:hypothetical protein
METFIKCSLAHNTAYICLLLQYITSGKSQFKTTAFIDSRRSLWQVDGKTCWPDKGIMTRRV